VTRAWKDLERRVCRALGGERRGPTGKDASDCVETPWAVEVKRSRRKGPPVLAAWIEQARRQGRAEKKPWALVVAGHYDRSPVCVVDFATFCALWDRAQRYEAILFPMETPTPVEEPDTPEEPDTDSEE